MKARGSTVVAMDSEEARAIYDALVDVRPALQRGVPVALVDHYVGGVEAGSQLDGCGRATFALRDVVEGDFVAGKISHSPGALQYPDGYTAVGPLTPEGVPTGPDCCIRWPSGESYSGALVNGVRHGHGCQTSVGGQARYDGEWHRGRRHGRGTQCYADGSRYDGEWADDERHGYGRLWYKCGDCYEGQWSRGERVGEGCMGWRHGTAQYVEIYQGTWVDGQPHGVGSSTYIRSTSTTAAKATAETDLDGPTMAASALVPPSEYAAPVTAIVNRYVGEFVLGERQGRGTFFYADGSSYEGHWEHGERAGKGLITTTVGSVISVKSGSSTGRTDALADGVGEAEDALELAIKDGGAGGRKNRNMQLVPEVSVGDLRGLNDGTEEQFHTTITSLLLRYNTCLKALFTRYASASEDVELLFTPADWWRQRTPGHIGVSQMLRLLSDAGVLGSAVTPAAFIRCAATAVDNAAAAVRARLGGVLTDEVTHATEAVKAQLFHLEGFVHYRTFAESLIRLATLVCVGPRFHTLGDQVAALVEDYLRVPLASAPLFPATRRHMAVLRPHTAMLEGLFHRAVRLQLPQRYPFLPALVALHGVQTILQRVGISPLQAVASALMASSPRTTDRTDAEPRRTVPPGLSEPRGNMAAALYTAARGPKDVLHLSTVVADHELTVLDFVEVLAAVTELVAQREAVTSSLGPSDNFDSVLTHLVVPMFEQHLNTL